MTDKWEGVRALRRAAVYKQYKEAMYGPAVDGIHDHLLNYDDYEWGVDED